jgi:glycosyltransferase involved in cell wall biosynthesis
MMHIAYVCCDPGVPVFGCKGSSIHVQEVLRELLRQGNSIDLYAASLGGNCPIDLFQVQVHPLEIPQVNDHGHREQALFGLNETVHRLLSQHGPYQLIYERYSLFAYAAMEFARINAIPGILEVNSPLVEEQLKHRVLIHQELAERTARRTMTAAGAVVAVSEAVGDHVRIQRLDSTGIHVIPNGVDSTRFNNESSHGTRLQFGEFTVGFVGTLKPWHGVTELLKAFPRFLDQVPGSKLLIVGDGPELERLKLQAAELLGASQDRAIFLGAVEPSSIPNLLRSMDIAVAPYLDQENFYFSPLKIFEYMAAGLPIVASNVGQISELIVHGKSGMLVTPGHTDELSEALIELANRPDLCQRLGDHAKRFVDERFTWNSVVTRILRIAAELRSGLMSQTRSRSTQFSE